jgi:Uma2 family endonuclease
MWFMINCRFNAVSRFVESFWEFEIYEPHDLTQAIRFRALSVLVPPPIAKRDTVKPDLLVVLRESQANLRQFWEKSTPPPLVDSPSTRSRWEGQLRVHVFGGGTWLTEFSLFTGFCWGDFGPAGSYAPFTLAPLMRETLPVQLRRLGYRTVVFNPLRRTYLNARTSYRQYGFEEVFSHEDLPLSHVWQELSDREFYAAALQRLRETDDGRPVFAFILTIRNHGPHNFPAQKDHPELPPEWPVAVRSSIADYLERQAETNLDYAWLQEAWLSSSRPRVLVSFGDHWPSLEGGMPWLVNHLAASRPAQRQVYRTPLVFEANYPGTFPCRLPEYDVVYLGATLLEFTGLPTGEFFRSNLWLRDQCAGAYVDAPDQPLIRGYLTWAHDALGAWQ